MFFFIFATTDIVRGPEMCYASIFTRPASERAFSNAARNVRSPSGTRHFVFRPLAGRLSSREISVFARSDPRSISFIDKNIINLSSFLLLQLFIRLKETYEVQREQCVLFVDP